MKLVFRLLSCFLLVLVGCQIAAAQITVTIEYPYPDLFNSVHEMIIEKFEAEHLDIKIKIRTTYENYEDGTQKVLRQAMTNTLPDITFQGLNRFRVFVDRGIAQPLDSFIDAEKDFGAWGFHAGMFSAGQFGDHVYALPFAYPATSVQGR